VNDVVAAAEARAAALVARDAGALQALLHPQLRWTTNRGEVLDRDEYVRRNTATSLTWLSQLLEDVEVVVEDGVAVLIAVVVDEVEEAGRRRVNRLRLTQTWILGGGDWRCIAGHASAIAG
jgi:Domain of unknown function (DUF4440)